MFRGGIQGAIERAAPTLAAAHAISRAVSIPVMAASGLSDITAPMALSAGARGVGVGSAGTKEWLICYLYTRGTLETVKDRRIHFNFKHL